MEFSGERYIPGIGGSIAIEHEHRYKFCLDLVRGLDVLDIACGEGYGTSEMARVARQVIGVDIDDETVQNARRTYTAQNLEFRRGDCADIPLADASIDVVVSFETIEHHDRHEEMMAEIRRVLRPGGALVISSPDKRTYSDERGFTNAFHVKELYADQFEQLLKRHFGSVTLFGQRIVYASALMPMTGPTKIHSYGIDQTDAVGGLHKPLYLLAIASDDEKWAAMGRSGLFEETVFRSEAVAEKAQLLAREQQERTRIAGELEEASRKRALAEEESRRLARMATYQKRKSERTAAEMARLRAEAALLRSEIRQLWRDWYGSTILHRAVFHRRGKPRGWVRSLLLKDRAGTPRSLARRVLFKKNGSVRPALANWYHETYPQALPAPAERVVLFGEGADHPTYRDFMLAHEGLLGQARTLHIVTTRHTEFIAEALFAALAGTRLEITRSTEMPETFGADLYIVVAPQMFTDLPPPEKLVVFQMEQVRASAWVDEIYLATLRESLAVLDYSMDNIAALVERGLEPAQMFYVPIRPVRRETPPRAERDVDVLFYGAIASHRRGAYIRALQERLDLRVETETFGPELREILDRTKIVANIHFYEDSLLETTRLCEALSHGAHVVSESATDQQIHGDFEDLVDFAPCGVVEAFVRKVEAALAAWDGPKELPREEGFRGMPYHVLRAMHGIGVLCFEELSEACSGMALPSDRLILCLPEQDERYEFALRNALPRAVPFHGLRNVQGWKGCASSYKFLGTKALAQKIAPLMIYEDDATFAYGARSRLEIIEKELKRLGSDWDIFSGLLSDLRPEAQIEEIYNADTEEFILLDSIIGMVFTIYSGNALRHLADFGFPGEDTAKHTIDRHLEALNLRTVTVYPPLVGHSESLDSTLWSNKNLDASPMIQRSISRLAQKREEYLLSRKDRAG